MSGIAATSIIGGLLEAVFLVVVTRTAFAITEDEGSIDLFVGTAGSYTIALVVALGLLLARLVLGVTGAWWSSRLTSDVGAEMRVDLAHAFLRSPWSVQQRERGGHLQELLTEFTSRGQELVSSFTGVVTAAFNLLALLALAVAVDPAASLFVVAALVVLGAILRPLRGAIRREAQRAAQMGMHLATSLNEVSQLGMEMHVFNVRPQVEARVDELVVKHARISGRVAFLRTILPALYTTLAYLAIVGALAVVITSEGASIDALGAVMLVMLRSLGYGQALQVSIATMNSTMPFVATLEERLAAYESSHVPAPTVPLPRAHRLEVDDVSFSYDGTGNVLEDVDLEIGNQEVIGIVGPSGSGKTTLVQLMLGLRAPTSGRVLIGGLDISTVAHDDLRRRTTFVPQSPRLIAGSVADNIRFMRDVSDEEVERAARLAHLHEEIVAAPGGYRRDVGERGGNLSGGQQQRLCIARALVEDPDILVLDEPTSSLDVRSESLIRATLAELGRRMTVVVIAHRMSTLDICDRIIVVQGGRIRAFDTPERLVSSSEFYREALELSGLA